MDTERELNSESNAIQCQVGTEHFESVLKLTRALAEFGVAIRGHEYYPHFFGMWMLIAGSFRHTYRFLWDDRDQVLTVSEAKFEEFGNQEGDWREVLEEVIDRRHGADPFAFVENYLRCLRRG
jgi:hypothetical protein